MKILVFGAHPDDVELSVGGIVARHGALGYQVEAQEGQRYWEPLPAIISVCPMPFCSRTPRQS